MKTLPFLFAVTLMLVACGKSKSSPALGTQANPILVSNSVFQNGLYTYQQGTFDACKTVFVLGGASALENGQSVPNGVQQVPYGCYVDVENVDVSAL